MIESFLQMPPKYFLELVIFKWCLFYPTDSFIVHLKQF